MGPQVTGRPVEKMKASPKTDKVMKMAVGVGREGKRRKTKTRHA